MRNIVFRLAKAAAVVSIIGLSCSASVQGSGNVEKAAKTLVRQLTQSTIPGAAVAVIDGDQEVLRLVHGVRSLKTGAPVTDDTVFPLASVSKTFAGTLAAQLILEGVLDPEEPVRQTSPAFTLNSSTYADLITVQHVLSHSSGLVPNAYDNLVEAGQSMDVILPKFRKVTPMCKPGRCYGYQNVVFSMVEPAINKATGDDYATLIEERFFGPLAMETASVGFTGYRESPNKAYPHRKKKRYWQQVRHSGSYYSLAPAAGVNASLNDLAKWLRAHMGQHPDVIASPELEKVRGRLTRTRREQQRRFWRDHLNTAHYGLGWRIYGFEGETLIYHGGGLEGFRSAIAYAPDHQIGIVMVMNGETNLASRLVSDFWADVFARPVKAVAAR